ncbi:MAG TPA: nuclear transport factor 2 family protein [Terriglobales bacterium]|jgi:hypothetical protein|nr:nuclear transport factor 2 family protein [Terriglobales bacterium]
MRAFSLLLSAVLMSALAVAQTPPAKPMPSSKELSPFEQELVSNQNQFMQAMADKNVTYVSQSVAQDFRGVGNNGDYYDRDEVVDGAHGGTPKGQRMYDLVVVPVGADCAVVSYNLVVPGSRIRYRHMSDTWAKDNGKWKLKFQQLTINLFSATDFD